MLKSILVSIVAVSAASFATSAIALPIPGLFNTGTDASNLRLVGNNGVIDPHYLVLSSTIAGVATGVQAVTYRAGSYVPNDFNSRWISHSSNGSPSQGTTIFRLSFDLAGLDANTATITGLLAADSIAAIRLNGVATGVSVAGFRALVPFSIGTGFQPGINTLDFAVTDVGRPLALRVDELSGTADVINLPATAAVGLFGLGVLALGLYRRR